MRWVREGDVFRLLDKSGRTRALLYMEDYTYYCAVGPLGTSADIVETRGRNRRTLVRDMERLVRDAATK